MFEGIAIYKSFGNIQALHKVDIHIPQGSVYGLLGPNGAGKSTLLRCLTGAYQPDLGTVTLDGQPVWENIPVKQRIAYIPDDISALPGSTLQELAKLYSLIYPKFDWKRFQELSGLFRFSPKTSLKKLSKGMGKQAAFWLVLCTGADILVLDEPMDGLDPTIRRSVWQLLMNDVAEKQTTVLISSHNLRELENTCDRIGIMDRGQMILERSLSDLQEDHVKVQIVPGETEPDLDILFQSGSGRLKTWIVRGHEAEIRSALEQAKPVYYELLPMTLEEIFLYETGGMTETVKAILGEE